MIQCYLAQYMKSLVTVCCRQSVRQTDRQTVRQSVGQTVRQASRHTDVQTDSQLDSQSFRQCLFVCLFACLSVICLIKAQKVLKPLFFRVILMQVVGYVNT